MNINEPLIVSACGRGLLGRRRHCRLNSVMQLSSSACIRRGSNAGIRLNSGFRRRRDASVMMHSSLG